MTLHGVYCNDKRCLCLLSTDQMKDRIIVEREIRRLTAHRKLHRLPISRRPKDA